MNKQNYVAYRFTRLACKIIQVPFERFLLYACGVMVTHEVLGFALEVRPLSGVQLLFSLFILFLVFFPVSYFQIVTRGFLLYSG